MLDKVHSEEYYLDCNVFHLAEGVVHLDESCFPCLSNDVLSVLCIHAEDLQIGPRLDRSVLVVGHLMTPKTSSLN